jgi:TonB-dependent starch-binding outer membrane protein SusC
LKDASAAIYGAQAANGVILIKTKSGAEGKPRLNYQFYTGMMTPTVIPEVTNAAEYAEMLSEYQVYKGKHADIPTGISNCSEVVLTHGNIPILTGTAI